MENDGAEDHLVVLDSSSGLFNIIRHFEIYIYRSIATSFWKKIKIWVNIKEKSTN